AGVLILSASVLTLHPPLEIRPSIEFALQDLGTLPGDDASYAWGINAAGDVVGGSSGPNGMRAFLFTDEGGLAPLQCPDARPHCIAREVNVHGQVAGSAWTSPVDWPGHAIRWTGGTPEDLGVLGIGSQSEAW